MRYKKPKLGILDNMPVVIHDPQLGRIDKFVNWRKVDSSNVEMVGWDADGDSGMFIQFKGGARYWYPEVSRQKAVAVAYADSVGRAVNLRIKRRSQKVVKLR